MPNDLIAVTGATGNVGAAVVDGLLGAGHTDLVAIVRDPTRLAVDRPTGAPRIADYADPTALADALVDVRTLVFVASDGETAPMLVHHLNVVEAAVAAGVGHVVYLSIVDVDPASPFCFAPVHAATERALHDSGLRHTVVRSGMYAEFFARWIRQAASSGLLRLPMGSGALSLVSRSDVARCLARAAQLDDPAVHTATGDRLYTASALADLAASAYGVPVEVKDIDRDTFCIGLLEEGVGAWWSYAFTSMFEAIGQHRFEDVTDTVADLTGRTAAGFDEVVREEQRSRG